MYTILFLVRYLPFWGVPCALALFEVGVYFYNRRERLGFGTAFFISGLLIILSILWIVFEGYWRAGPIVKRFLESF